MASLIGFNSLLFGFCFAILTIIFGIKNFRNSNIFDISVISEVDQTLLAGMIVRVGSRMIDDSLRTKLFTLKQAMNEAG